MRKIELSLGWSMMLQAAMAFGLAASPGVAQDRVPEGLSGADWTGILSAYQAHRYVAFAVEGGYLARNPGQQWRTHFDGRGFEITPNAGGWSWGLDVISYGWGDAQHIVEHPRCISASGDKVECLWDDSLGEWYLNDDRGLEHGFTIQNRKEAKASSSPNHILQIDLAVRGSLRPKVSPSGREVTFVNPDSVAVVYYRGLTVFDATGAGLPAWFEVADLHRQPLPLRHDVKGKSTVCSSQLLRIVIDDTAAIYPLLIDPIAQQAYLKASNTDANDRFGYSVAASGDTVVVGAYLEDSNATGVNGNQADNSAMDSGAAYVFARNGATWAQQAYLKASNAEAGDEFGFSVSISGDTVVVGAHRESSTSIGLNGNQNDNNAVNSGAAYVYTRSGTTWTQQAYIKASNTGPGDEFGFSVAMSGDTVVVGAPFESSNAMGVDGNQSDNSASGAGATYVFVRSGTTWGQQAYLKASNTDAGDLFGSSVGVSSDTVVVGAFFESSNATGVNGDQLNNSAFVSGAAYVFVRDGTLWSQQAYLKASNTDSSDAFGISVAVSGDTVVAGARREASSSVGINGNQADNSVGSSGAAYVFVRSNGIWTQQAYLKASNTGTLDLFGWSVAVSGNTVVVGAASEDSDATGVNGNHASNSALESGAAYVFIRSGNQWSQQAYLKPSNTGAGDNFGWSVTVSGNTVLVGAVGEDSNATGIDGDQTNNSAFASGAAYIFTGVGLSDTDVDGVTDDDDNCPTVSNPDQQDVESDGVGDACDNCPTEANADQRDCDMNQIGDVCEIDLDVFVAVLLGHDSDTAHVCIHDLDGSGLVNGLDVNAYLDLVLSP